MKTFFFSQKAFFLLLIALVVSIQWSCKENTILPKDLVPNVDNINTFDTSFNLITHTLYQDSFLTGGYKSGLQLSSSSTYYAACGAINNDPSFGATFAAMHVEVIPAIPSFTFKAALDSVSIDSIVLSIPYKTAFGDTNFSSLKQRFDLYRSIKKFPRDSAQFEFTKDSIDGSKLLSSTLVNFNTISIDSPLIGTLRQQPQLRFRLPSWFADSVRMQVAAGTTGAMATFSSFLDWWKGFAIVPASSKGNTIGYFETYKTRLSIYYKYYNGTGTQVTASDVFSFDPNYCNRFNTITHNYSKSLAQKFINTKSAQGDSLLFVQNEPGLVNIINMPGLSNMQNTIVNKAELTFTMAPSQNFIDTNTYSPVPRLQIFKTDSLGDNDKAAEDYAAFNSASYVDGRRYNVVINGINYIQYRFTVTYSIQKIISQKDSTFRFKIMGVNNGIPAAYRSILAGSGSSMDAFKPTLKVIYTNINK